MRYRFSSSHVTAIWNELSWSQTLHRVPLLRAKTAQMEIPATLLSFLLDAISFFYDFCPDSRVSSLIELSSRRWGCTLKLFWDAFAWWCLATSCDSCPCLRFQIFRFKRPVPLWCLCGNSFFVGRGLVALPVPLWLRGAYVVLTWCLGGACVCLCGTCVVPVCGDSKVPLLVPVLLEHLF